MKKVLFVLFVMMLLVPVACGKGGAAGEFKSMISKAAGEVDACMKELEAAKTPEAIAKVGERFTKVTQDFQNSMVEFGKKNPTPPSEADQKALMEDLNKLNESMTAFSSKFAQAQIGGEASTNVAPEGDGK